MSFIVCYNQGDYCCLLSLRVLTFTLGLSDSYSGIRWRFNESAEEYLAMIRNQGFEFGSENVSFPYLWWSRPDIGMAEWLGFPVPQKREETLVNVVARKPLST